MDAGAFVFEPQGGARASLALGGLCRAFGPQHGLLFAGLCAKAPRTQPPDQKEHHEEKDDQLRDADGDVVHAALGEVVDVGDAVGEGGGGFELARGFHEQARLCPQKSAINDEQSAVGSQSEIRIQRSAILSGRRTIYTRFTIP